MTTDTQTPAWLTGILAKRSTTAIRILAELIEAGLSKGEVSANDVTIELPKAQSNVIGAVFKILPRFGFVHTERRVKTVKECKHGRRVDVWELDRPLDAKALLAPIRLVLFGRFPTGSNQSTFL